MPGRTGRFGRLPRTAPDISTAIISLVREYQAARERNIVDAWKNGGKFEGRKVTDQMLLSFFDEKLNGLDKNDPTYDDALNTADQYRFAVRNSKQELLYSQRKVSDAGMAGFYRAEASRHPVNSEMYRSLMKLSAQYHDRAGAAAGRGGGGGGGRGGGSGSGKMPKAQRDALIETPKNSELAWSTMTSRLLDLARQRGIINSGESVETATDTTGEGFGDLQVWQGDFSAAQDLVNEYATSPEFAADRAAVTAYIRKYGDPKFDGNFTLQGLLGMRASAKAGMESRLQTAMRVGGTKAQIKAIRKDLELATKAGSALSLLDPMASYEEAHDQWEQVISDPKSSPLDKWEATQTYRNQVGEVWKAFQGMAAAAGGVDGGWASVHAGRSLTEWKALGGDATNIGPTLWEESRGNVVGLGGSKENSDAYTTAQEIMRVQTQLAHLTDGTGQWVIARVDANGAPTQGADYEMGVVDKQTLAASGMPIAYMGSGQPSVSTYGQDGQVAKVDTSTVLEAVYGQPLVTSPVGGLGPDGKPTRDNFKPNPGTQPVIGAVFSYPDGSQVWQVVDSQGTKRFTTVAPFIDEPGLQVHLSSDGKGNVVVSWVADAGLTATTYNPTQVVDPVYLNPETASVMHETVFKSAFLAHHAVERNQVGGLLRQEPEDEKTLAAALAAEADGDPNVFAALMSEAQTYSAEQAASHAAQDAARDDAFAGQKYAAKSQYEKDKAAFEAGQMTPEKFNARALELLAGTGLGIPGYNELRRTPGADLSAYIKEWVGDAAGDLTKQKAYIDTAGVMQIAPPAGNPAVRGTAVPRLPAVQAMVPMPAVMGYKDDGRPVFGAPQPSAPPPAPAYHPTVTGSGKTRDDVVNTSPNSSIAQAGGTVGSASAALIQKYLNPPPAPKPVYGKTSGPLVPS